MKNRWVRLIVAALLTELLTIVTLVIAVAVFGPSDSQEAQAFAQRHGYWIGPLAGFVFTAVGGWFVARAFDDNFLVNGFLLGLLVALIDVSIIVASGSSFDPIFVVSNIGRLIAGTLGGLFASRPTLT